MKWLSSHFYAASGMVLLASLILISACKLHTLQTFPSPGVNNYQQQLVIRSAVIPSDSNILAEPLNSQLTRNDALLNEPTDETLTLIESVDWEHRQSSIDEHRILFEVSHNADSISYQITACDQLWSDIIRCSDMAYYEIVAVKGEKVETVRDSINLKFLNELFVLDRSGN
ncbi:hypothetical protein [Rhodohalobacter halophilus]|uniref:hypothetical protein n=1 Tax=Rhodohalobacter halophilus TaxID=1812810 RepID=UPI00083FD6D8|nr:hypothetical protein [Rhodohalobacter halophilus]